MRRHDLMTHINAIGLALAFYALIGFLALLRAEDVPNCEREILAWCKTYPGPSDVDCEKMAHDECALGKPPPKAELCKLRAKRLCADIKEEHEACVLERLQECAR